MITGLESYPAMKDSGVEWLGKVPEHWDLAPNRAFFDEIKDRNYPDEQMLSVTIKRGVIKQASLLEDTSKKDSSNLDRSKYKLVQPGDIAYNKMRAWQGAIGVSSYRGIISPAYVVQRPRNGCDPGYFHQLFRIPSFAKEAERWSYGITSDMWSLRPEHFKLIYSCLPPHPEQAAIVRYLDHVDRRVRRLVQTKRKLIALLTEQKQAIIHRAVTRGLDPDVPLKDSGVEWLGEVPEHWEVVKLSRWFRCTSGSTPARNADRFFGGDIPWVKTGELLDREIHEAGENITQEAVEASSLTLLPKDTLLIAMYGQGQTRGRTGLLKVEATVNQACLAILPNLERAIPGYLQLWFVSQYFQLRQVSEARNATQPNLNAEIIKSLKIVIPPHAEQRSIMESVRIETETIERAVARANREIELLNEYRTRLVADVVTGKLDVRKAAAGLPEVDPLDAQDDLAEALGSDTEADAEDLDAIPEEDEA